MEDANWMEENDCWEKTIRNSQQEARGSSHPCSVFDLPLPKSLWSFTQDGQAACVPEVSSDPQAAQPSSPPILNELRAKPSERARGGLVVSSSSCTSVFVQKDPGIKCCPVLMPTLVFMCTDSITTASQFVLIPCPISQKAAKPTCEEMDQWFYPDVVCLEKVARLLTLAMPGATNCHDPA